ncbi:hypothetical protein CANCADRAFT_1894 [Tortispora caseinolytica NRRL Y-17796]|uniref:Ribophorin II n=1 Tax=Tortispora caseinolytica NRRL Y-17796 TaxID=767744 RepID=A0A1E4TEG4_9ASCO|nr:hypothetical protein CANCADRAFT_1894 [Tortispora caseinolytica NRRL Y-17796]
MRVYSLIALASAIYAWKIADGEISVNEKVGIIDSSSFTAKQPAKKLEFNTNQILRVKFNLGELSEVPNQVFVQLIDSSDNEAVFPVQVRNSGRSKVSIESKTIPLSGDVSMRLLIGAANSKDVVDIEIGSLNILSSASQKSKRDLQLHSKPEQFHTFNSEAKPAPIALVAIFASAIVASLAVLIFMWNNEGMLNLRFLKTSLSSLPQTIFLASIISIQVLFHYYYLGASIFTVIKFMAVLLPALAYSSLKIFPVIDSRILSSKN